MSFTNWFPDVFRSSPPSKDGDETGKNNEDDVSKANDDGIITKDEDEIANENDDGILKGEDAILKSDNNIPKNDKDEISIRDEFDIPKDVDDLFDKQVDASLERELLEALDKEIAEDQTSTPLEEEGSKEQTPSSLRTDGKPVNFMVSSPSPKTSQPPILRERLSLNTTENAAPSPVSLLIDSEQPYVPPTYLPTGLPQAVWGEGPIPDFDRTKLDHFRDYMSANFSESPVINQHLFNELSAITDYGWNNINDLVSRGRTKTLELLIGRSDQLNLPRWHTALDLSVQNPVKRGHINILEDVTGSSKQFESRSPPLQGKEAVPLREQGPEISSAEDPSSPSSFVHPPEEVRTKLLSF